MLGEVRELGGAAHKALPLYHTPTVTARVRACVAYNNQTGPLILLEFTDISERVQYIFYLTEHKLHGYVPPYVLL